MFHLRRTLRFAVPLGLLLSFIAGARAELVSTSPFLPPQSQIIAAPIAPPNLEFKGISTMDNAPVFLIFDSAAPKKKEVWLKLNEPGPGFAVRKYDPDADTVTVDYQGRSLTLTMKTPKIATSGPSLAMTSVPVNMVMPMPTPMVVGAKLASPPTVLTPVPPHPTSPAEAERMKEWTDEIEKRRAVRNTPAGTAPTPTPSATPRAAASSPAIGRSGQSAPSSAGR